MLTVEELDRVRFELERTTGGPVGTLDCEPISGGRSNVTLGLHDGTSQWVLRMPPRVGRTPSAHDVAREYRVTAALRETDVPVPPAVMLCEDSSVLGVPFAVAERVRGRTYQTSDDLGELDDAALARATDALLVALASLHRVDPAAVGLDAFGQSAGYALRQLKRWSGQWEIVGAGASPETRTAADELVRRLSERLPEQRSSSVVHGDYRIDNTLIDDAGATISAVVDWELSTLGDPVADVALMCAYRLPAFDLVVGQPAAWTSTRLPSVPELAEAYRRAGGVELADFDRHLALANLKIAVIAAGIDHRRRAGAGSGQGFDTAGSAVHPFLVTGLAALDGAV